MPYRYGRIRHDAISLPLCLRSVVPVSGMLYNAYRFVHCAKVVIYSRLPSAAALQKGVTMYKRAFPVNTAWSLKKNIADCKYFSVFAICLVIIVLFYLHDKFY